ncbi:MAG: phosphoribosylformylglycinamidine synthase [Candidatus Aenigmarchaeota archaeon]|nr:phosphoribosylformylglycinamidine synthase [Candidatus Aenigmarchaeota archaeon]
MSASSVNFVEVGFKGELKDPVGDKVREGIKRNLGIHVDSVRSTNVYTIDREMTLRQLEELKENLFADPVVHSSSINRQLNVGDFDFGIEVGYKAGVKDNVGDTARTAIEDVSGEGFPEGENVYSSRRYFLKGDLSRNDAERIARKLLANDLIESITLFDPQGWKKGLPYNVKKVTSEHKPQVRYVNLDVSDEELMRLSDENVWSLNLKEMKVIGKYFSRPDVVEERKKYGLPASPTDTEIEVLAQTWSDHCKHKNFNKRVLYKRYGIPVRIIDSLYKTYIQRATEKIRKKKGDKDFCVSVFTDNAGVVRFNDKLNIILKVETHNAPSALDPYGGAITGIVGVNRDPMGTGMGGELLANTDFFCFAPPDYGKELPYKSKNQQILHPARIKEGVRQGVEDGGNQSGIPTVSGGFYFHDSYLGKPCVHVGTLAKSPPHINGKPSHVKEVLDGDYVVMVGGRVGKDGIHGATFSSEDLREGSPTSAVQIGDSYTQKIMYDFLMEARDLGYFRTLTDNGAGGLSSSVGEMARLSGGFEIDLEKVPLKYAGLDPWEIMVSESQERMTVVLKPEYRGKFLELAKRRGVEATILGNFNKSDKFHVRYGDQTVAYLDMDFVHEGVPQWEATANWKRPKYKEPEIERKERYDDDLSGLLSSWNICSREWTIRQYDHEVKGGSVVKPLVGKNNDGPSDASIIRPDLESKEGLIVTHGHRPSYSDIDTYWMAATAIDEGIRNVIAVGGNLDWLAFNDNFCWPSPIGDEYKEAQLDRANKALYKFTKGFGTPCISGKDSMSIGYNVCDKDGNKLGKIAGQPSLLMTAIGKIDDSRKAVTMDFKSPGDFIYVVGKTYDELGGSEYYNLHNSTGNKVPKVRLRKARKMYRAVSDVMGRELVESCHDCSEGGLAVALAESSFAGGYGTHVDLSKVPASHKARKSDDILLFSESNSRFVVTVAPENRREFERAMKGNYACVGRVTEDSYMTVKGSRGNYVIDENINHLKAAWQSREV